MSNVPIPHTYSGRCIMTSLWVIGLFLIGDCISTSSPLKAKEGSCVKILIDMKIPMLGGNVVWLKNATWNSTSNDFEGTVVYSLKADKPAAKEFENRVSVGTSPDRTTSQLTISNLRLEDNGIYLARYYTNEHQWGNSNMSLEVEKNPCQVSVSGPELVRSGETVHLQCSVSAACEDRPEWAWSESAQLPSSSYSQDGKTAKLSFPALWSHDGVTFTCSPSRSKDACVSRSIKLTVRYAPKGVSVWTGKASDSVREGERISFTCKVQSSNPPASYSWYKDWSQLGCTDRELNLTDIKLQDTGNYYCRATNPVGYKESPHVQITVLYGPRDTRIVASEGGVKVGRSLTLTCHAEALPKPNRYTWFHALPLTGGWTEVPAPSNRPSDRRALSWEQISVGDAGEYICQAGNEISAKNSTSHRVYVLCECCLRHPTACPVITEGDWGGRLRRNPEREAEGKQGE